MNRLFVWLFYVSVLSGAICHGAGNPFVQFPTGSAAWSVSVAQDKSTGQVQQMDASGIASVAVQQNERIRRNVFQYTSGKTRESWDIPGTILIITEDFRGTAYVTYPNKFFSIPFLPNDFNWISSDKLQEKQPIMYQGKLCFHFKGAEGEAWIDSKTLFPVALKKGGEIATFTLEPSPTAPLILPARYQAALDYYNMSQGKPHQKIE